ncbi:C45 family autoproteolytic acyltransferase/hydolase [Chryseolinea lacunae]|uniref:Peptidase C45 hydrolase domain-containing protein n=1 Tax=Chryseolinea lacunae TaxID=2801331 RepID=A0ABS1KRR7_9BACT|nr:C45 family peptidase [Chryseolinea lacunae]MBL0742040.1 hypothetical protein [Chryseolinea lacunae]
MKTVVEHIVDLDLPVETRWSFLKTFRAPMGELMQCYLKDFEDAGYLYDVIDAYKLAAIPEHYREEISFIASLIDLKENEVLLANLYYDILKFYFGCTAFAVNNGSTTYHCRNLDWHTENNLLGQHTMVFDFHKNGKTLYKTIGWPGFVGALSGTKPGKFSLTLNAVLSNDKPEMAYPVSFLLRDVLTSANSFSEARQMLMTTTIVCDCLILLSGIGVDERVVIERTPTRSALREAHEKFIAVTNDYKKLENGEAENILRATSCSRYDRALEMLRHEMPQDATACLSILKDEDVQMQITVQQMIFDNHTGDIWID